MKLRGVTYLWNPINKRVESEGVQDKNKFQMGFIAQEAIEIIPEVVDYNAENDSYAMQYAPINALLVEAIKEQQKQIEFVNNENNMLKNEVESLKAEIEAIKALLGK